MTAFYGILEPDIGRLRYVNAGHNPPFLLSSLKGKRVDRLTRTGIPLGISPDATWQQKIVKFSPGDLLVLYTDGITEARNRHGAFYGDQRLLDVLRTNLGRTSQEIQQAVLDDVQRFWGRPAETTLRSLSWREELTVEFHKQGGGLHTARRPLSFRIVANYCTGSTSTSTVDGLSRVITG